MPSRGAKLSKAERLARRDARLAAAASDASDASAFEGRRAALLAHVSSQEWDAALALGGESVPLATALVHALLPLGRLKILAHCGRRLARTLGADALRPLVAAARGDGRVAAAVALARGLGIEAELDVPELVLRSLEDGQLDEANDIVGADGPAAAAVLRKMLDHSRCLPYALSFLPALRHVPPPDGAALARLGGEALALVGGGGGDGGGGDGGAAAATREAVRAEVEAALRSVWAAAPAEGA